MLHGNDLAVSPEQSAPPLLGAGSVHDLDLDLDPVPQVRVHEDHKLQLVHPPSTEDNRIFTRLQTLRCYGITLGFLLSFHISENFVYFLFAFLVYEVFL